jgi:hypothetical protein
MQVGRGEVERQMRTEMSLLDLPFSAVGFMINTLALDEYVHAT